jgi:hypothetical protein
MSTAPPPSRARLALAVCAPLLLAAVPATLSAAPVISANAVCVRPGQLPNGQLVPPPFTVSGSGFGPGAGVELVRGARRDLGTANPDGTFSGSPYLIDLIQGGDPVSTPFTIVANDTGGIGGNPPPQGLSNELRLRAAPLAFSASPERARPSARITFRFSGFTPDTPIWAHYRYKGSVRANVRLGLASNPCGLLTVRRKQIPVSNAGIGLWSVQFDHNPKFSPRATPRRNATITVYRTFR